MNEIAPHVPAASAENFRSEVKPIWCPGCGHYGVLAALTRAFIALGRPSHEIAVVSGIGCSSRLPAYLTSYGFHGVHGRALPFATGLKVARPELEVVAIGGDGDGFSIGGNHFLHACRRNVDMAYVVMDNEVYGMTKGQPSPTTEPDWDSPMAPGGTGFRPFDPLGVALAAGAGFVARGFSGDPNGVARLIVEAIRFEGFAFVEVLSPCVTFRPEEKEWKHAVHPLEAGPASDPAEAHALVVHHPFGTGIFYRGTPQPMAKHAAPSADLAAIERDFVR